jgi:hypothetical protein
MSLESHKIALAQKILSSDNISMIKQLETVYESNQTDFWDELTEQQKLSVMRAKQQVLNGEVTPHKEVMSKYNV